jgi:hypothetical protein
MGKIKNFRIVLSKPTFFSVEPLAGSVLFQLIKQTKVYTLRLFVEGKGRIKW